MNGYGNLEMAKELLCGVTLAMIHVTIVLAVNAKEVIGMFIERSTG